MKTIFKDKNIRQLEEVILLSDGTPVAEYTKFDDKQKYVLIGDKEFGPFEGVELFLPFTKKTWVNVENYYFVARKFDKKVVCFTKEKELPKIARENQNREFSAASKEALDYFSNLLDKEAKEESKIGVDALIEELTASIKDFENPYIKQKGKYYYFEINDQSFGPFSYIWGYDVNDKEHFQLAYVSSFNEMMLNYMLDGKYVTSVQLEKPLEDNTPFLPYFSFMNSVSYTKSGKAVFSNIPDSCIYIDGKRVDYFGGECSDIDYFEKDGHFLASGHPVKATSGHWYCYDGKIHKNWHNARFLDNGKLVYLKTIKNKKTGKVEASWYLGKKRISVPVNAAGTEKLIEFGGSLIYYLRDKTRYILMNGKEYQGFRVNYRNVALLTGDEIKLYQHKDEFENELELAEYLGKNNLLAGAGDLPVTV